MTERLYYTDASCAAFDAVVTRTLISDGRPAVVLDRTAFYPTSGGQPFDTGQLGAARVIETLDLEDDDVLHVLSAPLSEGERVHGAVDWPRRCDHMQQHTGQHVLSAAFDRLFGARTVGFHLGADVSTIDLSIDLSTDRILEAEETANRVVWEDRAVAVRFASPEEAAVLPLRKDPTRAGTLRLIEVEHFDLSACGGTHVSRTGQIGVVAVSGWERFKGGTRLTFVCGGRALALFRRYRDTVAGSIRLLSVVPEALPAAIQRTQDEARDQRRTIKRLQDTLAGHEAARLVAGAPLTGAVRVLIQSLEGWDVNGLKAVAVAATGAADVLTALFTTTTPAAVVIARSKNLSVDAQAILEALTARFGGRGGGKADLAQGGGFDADLPALVAAVREAVDSQLG